VRGCTGHARGCSRVERARPVPAFSPRSVTPAPVLAVALGRSPMDEGPPDADGGRADEGPPDADERGQWLPTIKTPTQDSTRALASFSSEERTGELRLPARSTERRGGGGERRVYTGLKGRTGEGWQETQGGADVGRRRRAA